MELTEERLRAIVREEIERALESRRKTSKSWDDYQLQPIARIREDDLEKTAGKRC